jgi:DNA (cytosine-5)-methyltransferase 1
MRYISLFSGIEAASCAFHPLGWEPVAFAETDRAACELLAYRWPGVPNLGDVSKITDEQIKTLGRIDVVVAGWPCQDVSIAGKRKGFKDVNGTSTRSGLFFEAIRLIRAANPRWLVAENVPGLFSSHGGRDFATVVGETLGLTFDVPRGGWPNSGIAASARGRLEWAELDAQFWHLAQRRERVFFVGYFGADWSDFGPILLERESLLWNPPPSRQSRKDLAPTISACTSGGGGLGTDFDLDGGLIEVTHAPRADGFDASEDGTGRGTPLVPVAFGGNNTSGPIAVSTAINAKGGSGRMDFETETLIAFSCKDHRNDAQSDIAPAMRAMNHTESHANAGGQLAVAFALRGREGGAMPEMEGDTAGALRAASGGSSRSYVAFHENQRGELTVNDTAGSLKVGGGKPGQGYPAVQGPCGVRRLVPVECERLMGVPDNYTRIPTRIYASKPRSKHYDKYPDQYDRNEDGTWTRYAADGPRYKQLGNSFPVPVVRWIGTRIAAVDKMLRNL